MCVRPPLNILMLSWQVGIAEARSQKHALDGFPAHSLRDEKFRSTAGCMSGDFTPSVMCASCKRHVVHLSNIACMQDSFGFHLVCALDRLGHDVEQRRPHPDAVRVPFKRGKLICSCGGNIGNIHNNVKALLPTVGLKGRGDYAVLKLVDLSFIVTPDSELISRLTGTLLGKAVGFVLSTSLLGVPSARRITPNHVLEAAGRSHNL